jgi:hypothetical protein
MEGMIIHRGGELVTRDQLDLIKTPEQTDSYVPVSHYALSDKVLTISRDILRDYSLVGENYAVARQGNQMFALLKFKNDNEEMGLSVAFRNSYDKSMSVGIAIGASVFICDNLALHGDIAVMKKHTKGVWDALEDLAISSLYKAQKNFDKIVFDSQRMKELPLNDDEAFRLMGYLYGHDLVSPRQLTVLKDEWQKPSHEEFQGRNMWSLFNATTEALKSCPPTVIMEKHAGCYQALGG